MAEVDGKAVCAIVPSDREVSLKKLATAFDGKTAKMMGPADAERTTARTGCFAARRVRPITLPISPVIPIIAYIDVYSL
jgi:Cys-tRNA(Pro)/Cys-tRNA(Cys) deacylase